MENVLKSLAGLVPAGEPVEFVMNIVDYPEGQETGVIFEPNEPYRIKFTAFQIYPEEKRP